MARNIADSRLGVALTKCYFCQGDDKIVLNSTLTERHAAAVDEMHQKVIDMEPCAKCEGYMKQGVIIITIDEEKSDEGWNKPPDGLRKGENWMPNPYRAGGWFVVTDDCIMRMINDDRMKNWALQHRWMFMEHQVAVDLGLLEAAKDAPQG